MPSEITTPTGDVAPIVDKGPVTTSAPLNTLIGAGIAAVPNVGFGAALQGMDPLGAAANTATAAFLNFIVAQPIKNIKHFPEQHLLNPLMFVAAFIASYLVIYHQEAGKAFINAATSTATAVAQYKADKAAGTNILPPTPTEKEFKS